MIDPRFSQPNALNKLAGQQPNANICNDFPICANK